nr:MAG TPA: hypothetical protein [Caudoviricetes sp.]
MINIKNKTANISKLILKMCGSLLFEYEIKI